MTKKEILDSEASNWGRITIYKEGTFWVAYERSAFLFHKFVRPYQVKKTFSKTAETEIVSLGFPEAVLGQLTEVVVVARSEERVVLRPVTNSAADSGSGNLFDATEPLLAEGEFEEWKESIELSAPKARPAIDYEQLPVFKTIYNLTLQLYRSCQAMEREFRYTIGEKIKREMIDLMIRIYHANLASDKAPHIVKAMEQVEILHLQSRLLHDLGQIPAKHLDKINFLTEDISRQLSLWYHSVAERSVAAKAEQ